jgi:para-nitrobenzyl esterase
MMPFHPMVDGDVVAARPADEPVAVPLIAGTTAEEMRLFLDPNALAVEPDRLRRRVARYCKVDDTRADQIVATYARELDTDDGGVIWSTLFSDVEMQVPLRAVLAARTAPTYSYLFTWGGPKVGACHGIDIPFPFDNFVDGWDAFVGLDDDGRALGRRIRDSWAAFARTGDPGWPQYPTVMTFGRDVNVAPSDPLATRLAAL